MILSALWAHLCYIILPRHQGNRCAVLRSLESIGLADGANG